MKRKLGYLFLLLSLGFIFISYSSVVWGKDGGNIKTEGVVGFKKKKTDSSTAETINSESFPGSSDSSIIEPNPSERNPAADRTPSGKKPDKLLQAGEEQRFILILAGILISLASVFLHQKRRTAREGGEEE